MAVKFGYGGLANTNGARDFTGKEEGLEVEEVAKLFIRRLRLHYVWFLMLVGL